MRVLRQKGAFAKMGFRFSDVQTKAYSQSEPGQAIVFCTKPDLDAAFDINNMCQNTLWIAYTIHMPQGMLSDGKEYKRATRGVVHLVLTTAEELGITNIEWDGNTGTCIAMRPRGVSKWVDERWMRTDETE